MKYCWVYQVANVARKSKRYLDCNEEENWEALEGLGLTNHNDFKLLVTKVFSTIPFKWKPVNFRECIIVKYINWYYLFIPSIKMRNSILTLIQSWCSDYF